MQRGTVHIKRKVGDVKWSDMAFALQHCKQAVVTGDPAMKED